MPDEGPRTVDGPWAACRVRKCGPVYQGLESCSLTATLTLAGSSVLR